MPKLLLVTALLWSAIAFTHPMGNFSVGRYSKLQMTPDGVRVFYVLDLAEIPTFELMQKWGAKPGSAIGAVNENAAAEANRWIGNLSVKVDGRALQPKLEDAKFSLSEGSANMPVARVEMWAFFAGSPGKLDYEDRNYTDRAGWKEVVVVAGKKAKVVSSTAGANDTSKALKSYPTDLSVTPPQVTKATVSWKSDADATSLTGLLQQKDIPFHLALVGMAMAFGLGAMHALSPGHGKAMVAAYLIGNRGTPKHALILGGTVTFTHTISVFALGFVTLFLSRYILPEKLYPILGAISGLMIVWLGMVLLHKRAIGLTHHHHTHEHSHDGHTHTHAPEGDVTMGSLITLGVSGGLAPCPTGLVLLLSSIALGRVTLGLVLLTAFSAGLASVLIAIGLTIIYAKRWIPDSGRIANSPLLRVMPVLSAFVILLVGLVMTVASLRDSYR
jgi:ABC-type nickel/cobalt efflux system permease component RcnA